MLLEDLTWMNVNWDSVERQSSRLLSYKEALDFIRKKRNLVLRQQKNYP